MQKIENVIQDNLDETKKREYFYSFINKILKREKKFLIHRNSNSLQKHSLNVEFLYIHFLIEVSRSRVLALIEIQNLIKLPSLSLHQLIYIHYLKTYAEESFPEETHFGNKLEKSLSYQEKLLAAFNLYEDCLLSKLSMAAMINQNFIDINQLYKASSKLLLKKNNLFLQLTSLASFPNKNPIFLQMVQGFYTNFSHFKDEDFFLQSFRDKNKLQSQKQLRRDFDLKLEEKMDIFSEKTCMLQIGIKGRDLGKIMNAQYQFYNMFGFRQKDCQHIDQIIPSSIQQHHQYLLKSYLTSFDNKKERSQHFKLLLAQDREGWAIPISMIFQITHASLESDVHITAVLEKLQNGSTYLMSNLPNTNVLIIEQSLYSQLFTNIIHPNQVRDIYLARIMPRYLLSNLIKNTNNIYDQLNVSNLQPKIMQTLLFIPKSSQTQFISNLMKPLKKAKLRNYCKELSQKTHYVYSVKYKIHQIRNQYILHDVIEYISINQITSPKTAQNSIISFQDQIHQMIKWSDDQQSTSNDLNDQCLGNFFNQFTLNFHILNTNYYKIEFRFDFIIKKGFNYSISQIVIIQSNIFRIIEQQRK